MSNTNIGVGLLRIHSVITRGLKVAGENTRSFAKQGYPDRSTEEGFIGYVRCLVSVLDAHHLTEEDLAFPYYRGKFPEAPYELLMAQHRDIVLVLNEIKAAIEENATMVQVERFLNKLNQALKGIDSLWNPHIRIEEDHFTVEKTAELIDPEDHVRLSKMFSEHMQQHAGPDYLVVPFLLYNLPPEERGTFADEMPPIVTQQLVPVVWKEKWKPMAPFLLP